MTHIFRRCAKWILAIGLSGAIGAIALQAEELKIGVPNFSPDMNLVWDNDIAARVLFSGVSRSLVRYKERSADFDLDLADRFEVDGDFLHWSFRVSPLAKFQNGEQVSGQDVIAALDLCKISAQVPAMKSMMASRRLLEDGHWSHWVDFDFDPGILKGEARRKFPKALSRCWILEQDSQELFGKQFGEGANLIGSGNYRISTFRPGRKYTLVYWDDGSTSRPFFDSVTVSGVLNSAQGLTSLRSGNLDLVFGIDKKVAELASRDETLALGNCLGNKIVYRRNLKFNCSERIDFSSFEYGT